MNRLDIFCFVSVARTLSFSITARELMISQQAVSRHIRNLEEEVGYPLFLRNSQNIILSKAGEKMLAYFSQRDQLFDEFKKRNRLASEDNILKIAWSQWLSCPDWFHNLITRFQEQHPETKMLFYDLNAKELVDAQLSEGLDFILTTQYNAKYLPVYWKHITLKEVPIIILRNSESRFETEYKVWAADTGELGDDSITARTLALCKKLNIPVSQVSVLPDMGSVCLNILASGGIAFGIKLPALEHNHDFSIKETNLTATTVLCTTFQNAKPSAVLFEQFITSEMEELKHDRTTN